LNGVLLHGGLCCRGFVCTQFSPQLRYVSLIPVKQGRSHGSNIWGVHLFFPLQTSNYSGQRRRVGWGRGVPLLSRLGGLAERRKLPSEVWDEPQTIWGCFMCNFMRFHACFSAFNSCLEMGDFYIHLLASRSDVPR